MNAGGAWIDRPGHQRRLRGSRDDLLRAYQYAGMHPRGGFGWLGDDGTISVEHPRELWINARMVHIFALADLDGRPGALDMVEHGIDYLTGIGRDDGAGGWFWAIGEDDAPVDTSKQAYGHAFVLLAACSALLAGEPRAGALLEQADGVINDHFWDENAGMCRDTADREWSVMYPYRGQNANMHMTEAYLAAAEATGEHRFLDRASRIATRLIRNLTAANDWRLSEHYDIDWNPALDYNRDDPENLFRPYGSAVGHWFEWSKLLVGLHATAAGEPWMLDAARTLFDRGVTEGWDRLRGGILFTVDWRGQPLNTDRYHWVIAEAIGAAASLWRATGDPAYDGWYRRFWSYADRFLIDPDRGSWRHQLDEQNRPTDTVWKGRPDAYHPFQAILSAMTPLDRGVAAALADKENRP